MPETVTLGVIAYNEERFLPELLRDLTNQTYPHDRIELILVDGASGDGTRAVMEAYREENPGGFRRISVLDNPKRIQAAGWNVVIRSAACDVIIRIDAHTHIPPEFTEKSMARIQTGEMICGGTRPCISESDTPMGRTLLAAENSLFGSSIGRKKGESVEYVKSVFHAAYRREVFEKAGLFNEGLLRTEDNEMHYRLREAGYRICYDPEIVSYQYARCSLGKMVRQKYQNGWWIGETLKVCPGCISLYHLIPAVFVLGILFTSVLAAFGFWQLGALMWCAYAAFAILCAVTAVRKTEFTPFYLLIPVLFLVLHLAYGVGTAVGLIAGKEYGKD